MPDDKNVSKMNKIFIAVLLVLSSIIIITAFTAMSRLNIAYAHSLPVTEIPTANSIIKKGEALPSKVVIDFSERPDPNVSTMQVLNSRNERVDNGNFVIIGDHNREAMTALDTHKLTDGVYTVSWMTQSADDGHIARGSYVFGIGNVAPGGGVTSSSFLNTKASQQQSQVTAVTSSVDGLIKWPLIVSQAAIVGGIFSHLFLWEKFGIKIGRKNIDGIRSSENKANLTWLKRFSIILVAASVAIIASGSSSVFLQITELSPTSNTSSYASIFRSMLHESTGIAWLVQGITSLIIIICSVSYYYLSKREDGIANNIKSSIYLSEKKEANVFGKIRPVRVLPSRSTLLYYALVMGAISIFADSITSHNAGVSFLPSVAVFLDWLHFMAVSMWVGGLFYMSAVLLAAIRSRTDTITKGTRTTNTSSDEKRSDSIVHHLAILLPRFSLIATISLGVIGISGVYMAWIQLHTFSNLLSTTYGNILIIKLAAAFPLVLLGGYHQLKVHRNIVIIANLAKNKARSQLSVGNTEVTQNFNNDGADSSINKSFNNVALRKNKNDIPSKFGKTIKIESLLAISVLLVASLLTITSPPSKMSSMAMIMPGSSSSSSPTMSMPGMSTAPLKNSTYVKQTNIMNVNTKIEVNPFYSGFNTFKTSFTDSKGKPYNQVSSVEMTFRNDQADIGPIVANLNQIRPGVYAVTGAYISQPGEWDITMAAQRPADYDLNYKFTSKIAVAPTSSVAQTANSGNTPTATNSSPSTNSPNNNNVQEPPPPTLDSFAWLAIGLAAGVGLVSGYSYKRSKQELRRTIEMLETD
jgi:copper transport protein